MLTIYLKFLKKHSHIQLPFRATSVRTLLRYTNSIGSNVYIGKNALIGISPGATFKIGDETWINENLEISCNNSIEIGRNVVISRGVFIGDTIHQYEDISKPISVDSLSEGGCVKIEDECWIGTGACILQNVTIGKHSVIGANAVVTKDVPGKSVVAGNPAKLINKIKNLPY